MTDVDIPAGDELPLFDWLLRHHVDHNVRRIIPSLRDGRLVDGTGRPIEEGEENPLYKGVLVVANGETALARIATEDALEELQTLRYPTERTIASRDLFDSYLQDHEGRDGAFVVNRRRRRIDHVPELKNDIPAPWRLRDLLPDDFVYEDGRRGDIGTRTRVGAKLAASTPETASYQIKQTGYGILAVGKVVEYGRQGLVQEVLFRYDPRSDGPFVVEGAPILGIRRTYGREGGRLVRTGEDLIVPDGVAPLSRL